MSGSRDTPETVRAMFDRIAPRYDLMNGLMTGWQDQRWRAAAARAALATGAECVLDAATGTGALARALLAAGARAVVGVDASSEMLERAAANLAACAGVSLLYADVMALPYNDGRFDACTIGFGLRNLPDYPGGVAELARVLAPGGRLVVLELTPLGHSRYRPFLEAYFERVVPRLGRLVSGDRAAYKYLPESVHSFPDAPTLAGMMSAAGLRDVRWRCFGAGSVALHVGTKPGRADV
jgi:demethylmenaquinone methyltransferase/2-methoxy-6-polyprenyl-1,4-benzoquinol methylase